MRVRLILVCAMLMPVLAACAAAPAAMDESIRELEQQQARDAMAGNRTALDRVFAPAFRTISPAGAIATKAELLEILAGGSSPYRSATYETQQVSMRGDMAWTVGLETVVFARDALGSRAGDTVRRRVTQIWERQGGQWRLVFRHATNVTS